MNLQDFGLQKGITLKNRFDDYITVTLITNDVIEGPSEYGINRRLADAIETMKHHNPRKRVFTVGIFDWKLHINWGDMYYIPLTIENLELLPGLVKLELDKFCGSGKTVHELETNLNAIGWSAIIGKEKANLGNVVGVYLSNSRVWLE